MTWRRLGVLVRQLPRDAALFRARRGGLEWDTKDELLAMAVDELRVANWQRHVIHGKNPPRKPNLVPRPGRHQLPAQLVARLRDRFSRRKEADER